MDYLKLNPLRDVAQADQTTKNRFANVLSQALFGKKAADLIEERKQDKNLLTYAGIGIKRKLDLCQDLRAKADRLDAVLKENEELHNIISRYGAALQHKPRVEAERQSLAQKQQSMADQLACIEAANLKRAELNKKLSQEIDQLVDQVRRERESPPTLSKSYLEKTCRDFARQNDEIESEIERLRHRKNEVIELLNNDFATPLRQLLDSENREGFQATKEKLEAEIRQRQKEYFEYKDTIEATNAKVSLQIARLKDQVNNKWQNEIEFLGRRIEDHKTKISSFNSEITELNSEFAHRKESLRLARQRLAELYSYQKPVEDHMSDEKPPSSQRRHKKLEVFADFLTDIFEKLKSELDSLWEATGQEQLPADFARNLGVLMDYLNEISSGIDNYRL